jgi:hypothetical protein
MIEVSVLVSSAVGLLKSLLGRRATRPADKALDSPASAPREIASTQHAVVTNGYVIQVQGSGNTVHRA